MRGRPAKSRLQRAAAALLLLHIFGGTQGTLHNHHHLVKENEGRGGLLEVAPTEELHEKEKQTEGLVIRDSGPSACGAYSGLEAEEVLAGKRKPYALGGVPEDCYGYGCRHTWWGRQCRWKNDVPPVCPMEMQNGLGQQLREAAAEGHEWAREILLFRPCQLFPYMQGRTLWIIGDSMSKDFAFAFQCFMLEYWDTEGWPESPRESPPVTHDAALLNELLDELSKQDRTDRNGPWALQWCVPMQQGSRMCFLRANFGTFVAHNLLPLLPRLTKQEDIVLLNFGLHAYDNGTLHGYRDELNYFGEVYTALRDQLPDRFFWRQTSVQHFRFPPELKNENLLAGDWMPHVPQIEQRCAPIQPLTIRPDGSLATTSPDIVRVTQGGRRNIAAAPILQDLGIPVVHVWNQSATFWDFHKHYHDPKEGSACTVIQCDCTHVCQPSWHQLWMPSLGKTLAQFADGNGPRNATFQPFYFNSTYPPR